MIASHFFQVGEDEYQRGSHPRHTCQSCKYLYSCSLNFCLEIFKGTIKKHHCAVLHVHKMQEARDPTLASRGPGPPSRLMII